MKFLCMTILLAGSVSAQVFKPIEAGRLADVNSQIIQPDQLNLRTLPSQPYQTGEVPSSRQRVRHKSADVRMADLNVLDLPMHPVGIVPQQNFGAKRARQSDQRAVLPDGRPAAGVMPSRSAPIRKRVINARLPEGEQELREQLRKLQVPTEKK